MARNEHVVNFQLHLDGTMRVLWLDGPEDDRPAIETRLLTEGMELGDVRVVRVWSRDGQTVCWDIVSTRNVQDMAPNTTTHWHGSRQDMAEALTGARQAYERAQRRRAKEREALMRAGWLTTHDRIEVRLTTATEGPPVSVRVSYDDGKPEPQPETEGQRLARFFATSAHEGHEVVRHRPPLVQRPDDREWFLPDGDGQVTATFSDWAARVRHYWGSAVHEGLVFADGWHNPFLGVPDAVIAEVRGTLRSWEAMRHG